MPIYTRWVSEHEYYLLYLISRSKLYPAPLAIDEESQTGLDLPIPDTNGWLNDEGLLSLAANYCVNRTTAVNLEAKPRLL